MKMYNSDPIEDEDRYCFYLHRYGEKYSKSNMYKHHIVNYCIRINLTEYQEDQIVKNISSISFADLKNQNITVNQLFQWSTSIDIIERYQMYLMNITNNNLLERFYNCTESFLGPLCQFQFYYSTEWLSEQLSYALKPPYNWIDEDSSIDEITMKEAHMELLESCYTGLKCEYKYPLPMCLDWREICDGKIDCLNNGIDEENCFELELNVCDENEYRCHNGAHCIPYQFWHDDISYPDCLDRSDEVIDYWDICYMVSSINCEEHTCRNDLDGIACGDGQCSEEFCHNGRFKRLQLALFSKSNSSGINEKCWNLMNDMVQIDKFLADDVRNHCPTIFKFPSYPIALGHIHFVYFLTEQHYHRKYKFAIPTLVCYNEKFCPNFSTIHSLLLFENETIMDGNQILSCHYFHHLPIDNINQIMGWKHLRIIIEKLFRSSCPSYGQIRFRDQLNCSSYSQLYQCIQSNKCISKDRLLDGSRDCPLGDDETYSSSCLLPKQKSRFQCEDFNRLNICVSSLLFEHRQYQCLTRLDQPKIDSLNDKVHKNALISFQTLCDGFEERLPLLINNENETDETHCYDHIWPCKNLYTQCDGYWNCANGFDELGCSSSFDKTIVCNSMEHICVSHETFQLKCLNLSQINDGQIDCLGGFDERYWCRKKYHQEDNLGQRFLCSNSQIPKNIVCLDVLNICDNSTNCDNNEDEKICSNTKGYCDPKVYETPIQDILCRLDETGKPTSVHFALTRNNKHTSNKMISDSISQSIETHEHIYQYHRLCNRGIPINMRRQMTNESDVYCLCPPNYYGSNCQYQNDRISLTLQFRVQSEWRTIFKLIIRLMDNDYIVHSFEQLTYTSIRDCNSKFTFYLLYKSRFKNRKKNYSIHIDVYLAKKLEYRASWLYEIQFQFLPVHRLAFQLNIPLNSFVNQCSLLCHNHGICTKYQNNHKEFCLCHSGWTGLHCNIEYQCQCSTDALCIGSSLSCLCPWNKFGRRCYLEQNDSLLCLNEGLYLPLDIRFHSSNEFFQCICPNDYSGDRCQYRNSRLDIRFRKDIIDYSNLLSIHLITVNSQNEHRRTTMLSRVNFEQTNIRLYTSIEFHLIFIQVKEIYYLIHLLSNYSSERNYSYEILRSQQCLSIKELFNSTILQFHPLRRAKYYHLACQEHFHLPCFYDFETFMCLCTNNHQANCFNFDFNMKNDCEGNNYCLNQGHCYQDLRQCPTISVCVCDECFYGSQCQFSTKGYGLSLDPILAYHIQANISFADQSKPVKTSLALVIIIFTLGILGAFLSIITFRRESLRQTGCGIYLWISSMNCLLIMLFFLLKFLFLLFIQNEIFVQLWILKSNCILMDYFLRSFLHMGDWINACVAIERVFIVTKGVQFDKTKSKKISKWIISLVSMLVMITGIHDPIHRRLTRDEDEHRTWCTVSYESDSILQYYDSIITILHFILPFLINLISSLLIVILTARMRSLLRKEKFLTHLQKQLKEYNHLIISSCLLVILSSPRLILSLSGGCMKSARDPWLFLAGYFISFIPAMLFFVVFVLTSKTYKQEFKQAMEYFRRIIRT